MEIYIELSYFFEKVIVIARTIKSLLNKNQLARDGTKPVHICKFFI